MKKIEKQKLLPWSKAYHPTLFCGVGGVRMAGEERAWREMVERIQ